LAQGLPYSLFSSLEAVIVPLTACSSVGVTVESSPFNTAPFL
jgi:hypothetical protein